ncbi:MAG: acyl-CoA dehydrogenase family protein [Deltaproteobacteria bacterium]|nr:acyl-CoA dehydrogenase family protein [Deltaproteobacteria bacterium]
MNSPSAPAFPPFTPEHSALRQAVKDFCIKEIAPYSEEWDKEGIFPVELFKKAGEMGLLGIRVDPSWGGLGMDWWATTAYVEGLTYCENAGVAMALMVQSDMATPIIHEIGTEEQKDLFLKPAVAGDKIAALGISEPNAGSDVANLECRARKVGDEYVISGQKLWITNGTRADFITLGVRTGEDGFGGISLLTFPTDVKGYSIGRKLDKIGNLASDTAELFFDECRVPARFLLGQENMGFYHIMTNFQGERLVAALSAMAGMEKAVREAIQYGTERSAFGRPIGKFQVWRHRFAEHLTAIEAGRWLCYRAVDLEDRGQPATREITMAKLFCGDLAQRVMYDCMQFYGGFGYTTEYPVGRAWRDIRLLTVGGGTSEVMKEILVKMEGL